MSNEQWRVSKDGSVSISGDKNIQLFRLIVLRGNLQLEMKGLKGRGPTAYSILKKEFGWKGSREKILAQLSELIANTQKINFQKEV